MRRFIIIAKIILLCTIVVHAQKNENLAPTPLMGFNSYDCYRVYLDQETAKKLIDVMSEKYLPYGYDYFVIDAGWFVEYEIDSISRLPLQKLDISSQSISNIDNNGLPEASKVYFPDGMKALADYAHSKGLKFGLHLMRGVMRQSIDAGCKVVGTDISLSDIVDTLSICPWWHVTYGVDMDKPGSYEYYQSMIDKMAFWGVDFIKYDDITAFPKEIDAVVKAIKKNGRDIVLSLSPGDDVKMEYLPCYQNSNMLRITGDVWDKQISLDRGFTSMKNFQGKGMPGFWPDLDMIALGPLEVYDLDGKLGTTGKGKRLSLFNKDQAYTFITQRAIAASPLIIGGDMLSMDDFTYGLLTNHEMLSCNQNGVTGFLTYDKDSIEIYKAPVKENPDENGWIAIFNRNHSAKQLSLSKSDFGFEYVRASLNKLKKWKDYKFKDIWQSKEYQLKDSVDFNIHAGGVVFVKYSLDK